MAHRKSTGGIVEKLTARGRSYGLRFRARGKRQFQHVGYEADGITRADAERELAYVLEQVRRGEWTPAAAAGVPAPRVIPTFHEWASAWFEEKRVDGGRRGSGLSLSAEENLRWQLTLHLLPTFAPRRLGEITMEDVDRWRRAKGREGRLAPGSINKCINTLDAIFETALEYGYIDRNPAAGRRRRLPVVKPRRTYIDRASHIEALLDAAGDMDAEGRAVHFRRTLLAVLVFAGLRIDECLSLLWRHVELGRGLIQVPGTKTEAAVRTVEILPALRDELTALAAAQGGRGEPGDLVFGTANGTKHSQSNIRRRVLDRAVARANQGIAERGSTSPLPDGLTPHSLRRTFASILYALGESPAYVMAQMGHGSPDLALGIYAREMARRDGEPERLKALVEGSEWAPTGSSDSPASVQRGDVLAT